METIKLKIPKEFDITNPLHKLVLKAKDASGNDIDLSLYIDAVETRHPLDASCNIILYQSPLFKEANQSSISGSGTGSGTMYSDDHFEGVLYNKK